MKIRFTIREDKTKGQYVGQIIGKTPQVTSPTRDACVRAMVELIGDLLERGKYSAHALRELDYRIVGEVLELDGDLFNLSKGARA